MLNLNTPQKLSPNVLYYKLVTVLPVLTIIWLAGTLWGIASQQLTLQFYMYVMPVVLVFLLVVAWLYLYLWWKIFTYAVFQDHVEITSGIIIRHTKAVNFNDLQSINVVFGPLLAMCGLRKVQGFTSSPQQLIVTGSNDSTTTRHVPDMQLVIEKELAEELARIARSGDVQKVQHV